MKRRSLGSGVVVFCLWLVAATASDHAADKKEIIRQARQSYYNLVNAGLKEFRCDVQPDWDVLFGSLKADTVGREQVLPILRKTHFELLVGPDGASTVSHLSELAPPNEEVAERVRKVIGGTEQTLTGFVRTWSQFMIRSTPLPDADSEYELVDLGDKYRIATRQQSADAIAFMSHDLQIEELQVTATGFSANLRFKFDRLDGKLRLSSYEGIVKAGAAEPQKISMRIQYTLVDGLTLPIKVVSDAGLPSGEAENSFFFSNYRVTKKN